MVFKLSGLKTTSLVLEINEDQKSFYLCLLVLNGLEILKYLLIHLKITNPWLINRNNVMKKIYFPKQKNLVRVELFHYVCKSQ